ncbi:21655_t:CDS:1, partial [Racocetra persica]
KLKEKLYSVLRSKAEINDLSEKLLTSFSNYIAKPALTIMSRKSGIRKDLTL